MSFSNYAAAAVLNAFAGKAGSFGLFASPPGGAGGLYAALATAADAATGTFTEATGAGYARKQIAPGEWTTVTAANPALLTNSVPINWPQATGDWSGTSEQVAVVLCDALTGGNSVFVCPLATAKRVQSGDTFSVAIGDLDLTLT